MAALLLTSCDKYLTPDNKTKANQDAAAYFSTNPEQLMPYAYSLMKDVVARTDVYEDGVDLYMPANKKSPSTYDQYSFNTEDKNIKSFYSGLYAVINMANCEIHYDEAGKYTAEMRWLRDYCYYILTQQFGEVPYVTEYINNSERSYPLTPLKTIYDNVISDLEKLSADASLAASSNDGHASQLAAQALLAKVCLAAGWDMERAGKDASTYFAKACKAADDVTKKHTFDLTAMSFEEKWSPSNENNAEVIFAVQYDRASWKGDTKTAGHGLQNTFGGYYGDCTSTGMKYSDSYHCINPKAAYLWELGDKRWDGTFMTEMYNSKEKGWLNEGYYAYYHVQDHSNLPVCLRLFNGNESETTVTNYISKNADRLAQGDNYNKTYVIQYTYPKIKEKNAESSEFVEFVNKGDLGGMFTAPSVKKFDDPNTECIALSKANCFRDIVLLHMSDIFLIGAEAYLKAGDEAEALAYLNAVRARSNAATISSFASYSPKWADLDIYKNQFTIEPIDLILDERARELFAEGHRWMDLHRTGRLELYNKVFNHYYTTQYGVKNYRPLPQAEISANDALTDDSQYVEWGGKR